MVTVKLHGGLGNQLFQYAFAKALACRLQTGFQLDISFFEANLSHFPNAVHRKYELDMFEINAPAICFEHPLYSSSNRFLIWLRKKISLAVGLQNYVVEPHSHFSEQIFKNAQDNTYYEGYWQSERYFQHIATQLKEDLKFKNPISDAALPTLNEIKNSESVCVHVRRTDYLTNSRYAVLTIDYYQKAVDRLRSVCPNLKLFVFSDDLDWCKSSLIFDIPTVFVLGNYTLRDEFEMMLLCKHHIIANSTLSWWAAWLNKHPNKQIIAPQNWFSYQNIKSTEFVPDGWIKI